MKFYEVIDPYYALVKAEDEESAREEYGNVVSDIELSDEIFEVPEDYALVKYSQAPNEDGKMIDSKEILVSFKEQGASVLIIDGSLL